jgi:multidrug resistance efflux pump
MIDKLLPFMNYIKIVLAASVFAAGFGLEFHWSHKTIYKLNQDIGAAKTTITSMTAGIAAQNAAFAQLQEESKHREELAQQAALDARADAATAELKAQRILASRPPNGNNICTAASDAFDEELKLERSK